eukprot:11682060-Karenia_brevis.AAC.1
MSWARSDSSIGMPASMSMGGGGVEIRRIRSSWHGSKLVGDAGARGRHCRLGVLLGPLRYGDSGKEGARKPITPSKRLKGEESDDKEKAVRALIILHLGGLTWTLRQQHVKPQRARANSAQ